jgi:hypothetical protein
MTNQQKQLRYLSHGIYLQIILGIGHYVSGLFFGDKLPEFFSSQEATSGLLILLGLNSLIYFHKYKKSLSSND